MAAPSANITLVEKHRAQPLDWLNGCERVLAATALIAVAPVVGATLLAVRTLSGRSPLIAHLRVGRDGEPFWMLKVRTMWQGRGDGSEGLVERLRDTPVPTRKPVNDVRVTSRFARVCRRFSIDELPQLLHVISGRMSLIGPRPLTRDELDSYYGESATRAVLSARPGLTGLWQILGRNKLTYSQRKRLDLFLVRHASFGLYWRILLKTPGRVLSGQDAW